ncbi:MAG: hypothetical protein MR364_07500, partial [Oscillospiraceae bacterium]|nr:hypothetical protein [Oscillospiraceae bacterium]
QNFVEWKVQKKNGVDVEVLIVDGKSVRENPYLTKAVKSTATSSTTSSTSGTSAQTTSAQSSSDTVSDTAAQ